MSWASQCVIAAGLILLAHSCYSAHEFAARFLSSLMFAHTSKGQHPGTAPPLDVCIETLIATMILCFGLVLGSQKLRPIEWPVWAGKIEREGATGFLDGSGKVDTDYRGNPFGVLESRPGFMNIRQQRRDFAQWLVQAGNRDDRD
ncbi:magnesium transporter [Ophiocordyceps camponoti-floridani]|uniref:Magnesium transporter n=1 Tax=Ophiocordyceps camponoti-floridani TaxID=2030778 RepID=A0A8H4VBZ1_9HYPO|nr:magnesium transporter [Ophiocordyceps camponoti-floridani]